MEKNIFNLDDTNSIDTKLVEHHTTLLKLCSRLETIADSLPNIPNIQECLILCRDIFPIVKNAHDFEEKILFPILHEVTSDNETLNQNLERLCYEHWEDESFAEEISEVFRSYIDEPQQPVADKLSYMLRGFFEGIRRHIAFEKEYLLPLLKKPA